MIDIPPMTLPPVISISAEDTRPELVKRKKDRRKTSAVVAIGAIIIMSDGAKCQVVGYDQQGQPLCLPVND